MGDKIVIHTGKSSGFTNTHQNSKAVSNRLSRAIGHLESIRRMVEDGRDCTEVLVQLSAVKSAVNNAGKVILQDYIEHCIADAFYIAAGINLENLIYSVLWIAVVMAGNTVGAIIMNVVCKEER